MKNSTTLAPDTYRNGRAPFLVFSELAADYRRATVALKSKSPNAKRPHVPLALLEAARAAGLDLYRLSSALDYPHPQLKMSCAKRGYHFEYDTAHKPRRASDETRVGKTKARILEAVALIEGVSGKPATKIAVQRECGAAFSTIATHWPSRDEIVAEIARINGTPVLSPEKTAQPAPYSVLASFGGALDLPEVDTPLAAALAHLTAPQDERYIGKVIDFPTAQAADANPYQADADRVDNFVREVAVRVFGQDWLQGVIRTADGGVFAGRYEENVDGTLTPYVRAWQVKEPIVRDILHAASLTPGLPALFASWQLEAAE